MLFKVLILFASFCSFYLYAIEYGGKFKSKNQIDLDPAEFMALDNLLKLNVTQEGDTYKIFAELKFEHDFKASNNLDNEYDLSEAYIKYFPFEIIELSAGKKHAIFGKADEFNPADFLTAEDYRYFITKSKAERALSNYMAQIDFLLSDITLSAYYVPFVLGHKYAKGGSAWQTQIDKEIEESPLTDMGDPEEPEKSYDDPSVALKLASTFSGRDIDLIYYNGYHHEPAYFKNYNNSTGKFDITRKYKRFQGLGLAYVESFESSTFRIEAAIRDKGYYLANSADGSYRASTYDLNVGYDYLSSDNFYINLQYIGSGIISYVEQITRDEYIDFLFVKLEDKFLNEDLIPSLKFGFNVWGNYNLILNPDLQYTISNAIIVNLGAYVFAGDRDELFGQYRDNDMAYLNLNLPF